MPAPGERVNLAHALRDAGKTAILAFGVFLPLVGFYTYNDFNNILTFTTRLPLLLTFVAVVAGARLFYTAIAEPWAARRRSLASRKPLALPRSFTRIFTPFAIGFMLIYPAIAILGAGWSGSLKWIDNFGIQILIYIMLGWGLNIVVGLAGLLDLGYVAFYAVGSYSYALLALNFGLSFWVLLPLAGILAAFWGIILGFPVLRLRGDYLAIVTLAFGEIIRIVIVNWVDLTNGYAGISAVPRPTFFGIPFNADDNGFAATFGLEFTPIHRTIFLYYVILALAMLTAYVTVRLRRLPVGRAWEALREDEIACRSLGINTTNTKLTAFAMGAMFGGFAGSFFAARQGFISPESFTFIESATILSIVVLGGMGSQIGVAIAAVLMIGGTEIMRELDFLKRIFGDTFDPTQYRMLLFGFGMVVIMVWKPRGLISSREPSVFLKERKIISADLVKEGHG
ncbi:MAG TPA: high-affinity branched-chain amino acid ABC transporter permease LivM [Pseudolabrys sp.]|nr:high-affinity branched-chain amino acid ABC transporter permease LivM [Pseudolabrys sp.]